MNAKMLDRLLPPQLMDRTIWSVVTGGLLLTGWWIWQRPMPMELLWVRWLLIIHWAVVLPLTIEIIEVRWKGFAFKTEFYIPIGLAIVAQGLPQGALATILTLPLFFVSLFWLWGILSTTVHAYWDAAMRLWLTKFLAFGFLSVGVFIACLDRFGVTLGTFDARISILTVLHLHYAGFGMMILAGLMSAASPFRRALWLWISFSFPITALGILLGHLGFSHFWETLGACWTVLGGLGLSIVYAKSALTRLHGWSRWWWIVGAINLFCTMLFALTYALRWYYPISFLSIPFMFALHGTLNAVGVVLPLLYGWRRVVAEQ